MLNEMMAKMDYLQDVHRSGDSGHRLTRLTRRREGGDLPIPPPAMLQAKPPTPGNEEEKPK